MIEDIKKLLTEYNEQDVSRFAQYCVKVQTEKNKDNTLKNYWAAKYTAENFVYAFKKVAKEGLVFDGVHITFQSTGISYDYIAYKNKMLVAYPESKIDVSVVNEGDTFTFSKKDGRVNYKHEINNPFENNKTIIGAYAVLKNSRGDFLTILNSEELEKHRKVAKTDFIWKQWYKEMVLKTVIKKACKQHFEDVYTVIEEMDNENYSLENPIGLNIKWKSEIDAIDNKEDLQDYYKKNKGRGKDFESYVLIRNKMIQDANN